ncbi:hypothetical protein G6F59_015696 [Rhizopus arrhizus]|nr:hypothetical protein G6F59_015696 [Rhizopus arrhizus]
MADVQHALDVLGIDALAGDVDGRVDHRQHHALHAIAEPGQVALLHFQQVAGGLGGVHGDIARQQVQVILLGLAVVVLALPQRVVTVKTNQADGARRRRRGGIHPPRIQRPDRREKPGRP